MNTVALLILLFVAICVVCFAWARDKGQPYTDDIQRENMRNLNGDNTK